MKTNIKILCVLLALILCTSTAAISVSAEDERTKALYEDEVIGALNYFSDNTDYFYRCEYLYNADGSTPDEGETADYVLAWVSAIAASDIVVRCVIGDYYFSNGCAYAPYELGYCIYSTKEDKCYSLNEAWEAQLPNTEAILAKLGTHIDDVDNEYTRYRKQIISLLGWEDLRQNIDYRCIYEYTADGSDLLEGATPDYVLFFADTGTMDMSSHRETIGNYKLNIVASYEPGYSIYSIKENKLYTIRQAYNEKLPRINEILERIGKKVTLYADVFEEFLKPHVDEDAYNSEYGWYGYDELYYYSYQKKYGSTEMFEVTPDYVLVDACAYHCPPANVTEVFGDYVVYSGWGNPEPLRYFIYTPKTDNIYTLREAYDMKLEGIMNVFTDYGLGFLLGDINNDEKLTVKDATYIQKCLANIKGFTFDGVENDIPDWVGIDVADFDLNYTVNIKDATAIQKRLAKID